MDDEDVSADVESKGPENEEEMDNEWMDIIGSGELMKKVLLKGAGVDTRPTRGNIVTISINGKLEDGFTPVDCYDEIKIAVGDCEFNQGIDLILPLMEIGEKSEIVIKPRLAYGTLGRLPDIPSSSTITYTVELLQVEDAQELETLPVSDRITIGDSKRVKGNFWYSRAEYTQALQCYRRALDYLDDIGSNADGGSSEVKQLLETRFKVQNNMAAAQLKIEAYDAALNSVESVLRAQPNNVKALFRKGKILAVQGNTTQAIHFMRQALKFAPQLKTIHQELSTLINKQKAEVTEEKDLYKRMLGQNNSPSAQSSNTKSSFIKWGLVFGSFTAAILSILAYRHIHGGI